MYILSVLPVYQSCKILSGCLSFGIAVIFFSYNDFICYNLFIILSFQKKYMLYFAFYLTNAEE